MENIEIKGEKDVFFKPTVNFNSESGKLLLKGESYIEDSREFYVPLIKWIENFTSETKKPIIFDIDLSYYNTSSSKHILEMFYVLKDFENNGGLVTLNWFYTDEDVDIEEEIEDFEIESGLKINLIKKG